MKYEFKKEYELSPMERELLEKCPGSENIIGIKVHFDNDVTIVPENNGTWIDVCSAEDATFKAGNPEERKISLGFSMKIPEGFEALLVTRSSTMKKYNIMQTNAPGVIDTNYSGTNDIWRLAVLYLGLRDAHICKGDRIAQFRLVETMESQLFRAHSPIIIEKMRGVCYKEPTIVFILCDKLDSTDRGGFGSTGR